MQWVDIGVVYDFADLNNMRSTTIYPFIETFQGIEYYFNPEVYFNKLSHTTSPVAVNLNEVFVQLLLLKLSILDLLLFYPQLVEGIFKHNYKKKKQKKNIKSCGWYCKEYKLWLPRQTQLASLSSPTPMVMQILEILKKYLTSDSPKVEYACLYRRCIWFQENLH